MKLFEFFVDCLRHICFAIVKFGRIPTHVVFLITEVPGFYGLDHSYFQSNVYEQNFAKITDCVEWCADVGVSEVSFHTFGCLTHQHSQTEVQKCIRALNRTLERWIDDSSSLRAKEIKIHVADIRKVLPKNSRSLVDRVQKLTRLSGKLVVNVVVGFVGEKDLSRLMERFQKDANDASTLRKRRLVEKLYKRLLTYKTEKPQLVVSNCRYKRLIDYLIWKVPCRCVRHIHTMWNEFSWLYFLVCVLYFQRQQQRQQQRRLHKNGCSSSVSVNGRPLPS